MKCPKCKGSKLFDDADLRSWSWRKFCPVCGHSNWLALDIRKPSALEMTTNIGVSKERRKVNNSLELACEL